jgi:hypothetical protein
MLWNIENNQSNNTPASKNAEKKSNPSSSTKDSRKAG